MSDSNPNAQPEKALGDQQVAVQFLGQFLVSRGHVTPAQLEAALTYSHRSREAAVHRGAHQLGLRESGLIHPRHGKVTKPATDGPA